MAMAPFAAMHFGEGRAKVGRRFGRFDLHQVAVRGRWQPSHCGTPVFIEEFTHMNRKSFLVGVLAAGCFVASPEVAHRVR